MALRLASPGISIREVDLTRGAVDFTLNVVGGIAAPFSKGPCNEITRINNEKELIDTFGTPGAGTTDYHYEAWYSASNFLSYGGKLDVVRCVGGDLNTANAAVGAASTTLLLEGYDDYVNNQADDTTWYFASKNPGFWAENIKVAVIDNVADQTLTPTFEVGTIASNVTVGYAVTQALTGVSVGVGTTAAATGYLKGIVTKKGTGNTTIDVRVTSKVAADGTETLVDYQQNSQYEFKTGTPLKIISNGGSVTCMGSTLTSADWYNQQNILTSVADGGTDFTTLSWRAVLNKPKTNNYVSKRDGANDAIHVVIVDAGGGVTGDVGSVLEKFPNLSKASDATTSGNAKIYWKDYIADNSDYIFAGHSLTAGTDSHWSTSSKASGFSSGVTAVSTNAGAWGQEAKNIKFSSIGNVKYDLTGGLDYTGVGVYDAPLGDILNSYDKFADPVDSDIRFLLQGGASLTKEEEQAKANKLIQLAEGRKDTVAVISPNRGSLVNVASAADQLTNTLSFFGPLTSSSYVVFDAGYQYVYDRFNKKFVWMPASADIAGCMVRTDRDHFPWFSPAGTQRGGLNFAIKLAFNPGQDARDQLYSNRINPITSKPGDGIILFGDKTGLAYESAFDRINVRRLFITIEKAIENAAKSVLFELNDSGTRSNFINIVEPFLRDVQAKRGIQDFLLVCDETNNTPDVIDRNEFLADIYVKPARSINFIGLTFVATRTGVSFSEVVGTV
tara:strand:- start:1125 stop:3311 length:2187 start_codon:yes stop_codon:yes gene_type:complete